MKEAIKDTRKIALDTSADSATALSKAYQAIDKAAKRGLFKKNTASRKKSRLSKMVGK